MRPIELYTWTNRDWASPNRWKIIIKRAITQIVHEEPAFYSSISGTYKLHIAWVLDVLLNIHVSITSFFPILIPLRLIKVAARNWNANEIVASDPCNRPPIHGLNCSATETCGIYVEGCVVTCEPLSARHPTFHQYYCFMFSEKCVWSLPILKYIVCCET